MVSVENKCLVARFRDYIGMCYDELSWKINEEKQMVLMEMIELNLKRR